MGDILEYCQGLLTDENLEGMLVSSNNLNNSRINRRKRSDIKIKDVFIPMNSTEDNNNSQCIITSNKLKNANKNMSSDENKRISGIKNEYLNGIENDLIHSISKMTQIIESLESKNKILEKEKSEIKKENEKLLKEIEIYKDTISKIKNQSSDKNESEDISSKLNNNNIFNENKNEKIKIIFLLRGSKKQSEGGGGNNDLKEEIIAYRYEMFIEVKLRLLKLKHLGPRDIKACYYNSKEINDWFTLDELNISDNTCIVCEYA